MGLQNKATLKSYFETGDVPTQAQFADLIDTFFQQDNLVLFGSASGTDTYSVSLTPALAAYAAGQFFFIKYTNANTGVATLNINGLGAKSLKKVDGSALNSGDISAGAILLHMYDGTNFQVVGVPPPGLWVIIDANSIYYKGSSATKVGIGQVTPEYRVDVSNTSDLSFNEFLRFGANNGGSNASAGGVLWKANYTGYSKISAAIKGISENDYFRTAIWFYTGDNSDGTTDAVVRAKITADGRFQTLYRFMPAKGSDVTAANDLVLGLNGNSFTITGNTTINAIATDGWAAGCEITLIFTGTPTIKHNTAGSGGTAKMFLAGSVDLTAANNTILKLIYDGTQWQEVSRKLA